MIIVLYESNSTEVFPLARRDDERSRWINEHWGHLPVHAVTIRGDHVSIDADEFFTRYYMEVDDRAPSLVEYLLRFPL